MHTYQSPMDNISEYKYVWYYNDYICVYPVLSCKCVLHVLPMHVYTVMDIGVTTAVPEATKPTDYTLKLSCRTEQCGLISKSVV